MATGKIKNVSDMTWVSVALKSQQYVDGIRVGECFNANVGRDFENYRSGKTYPFVFECDSVSGKNLPDGFSFEIFFSDGTAVYKPQLAHGMGQN